MRRQPSNENPSYREQLRAVVEKNDSGVGRQLALTVQAFILLSVVSFSVATLPHLSPQTLRVLGMVDLVITAFFTIEYCLRLYAAPQPWRYALSLYGIIDLLAILPFYLSLDIDLRSLRALRLLMLFRILKLARYNTAMRRFHRALIIAYEELVLFLVFAGIVLFLAATGIYYFENQAQPEKFASIFHSLWWAIVTLTTVGYGDVVPVTVGGRVFTFLVLLAGLGVVAIPAGLVASALTKAREMEE